MKIDNLVHDLRPGTTQVTFVNAMLNGVSRKVVAFGTGCFSKRKYGVFSSSIGTGWRSTSVPSNDFSVGIKRSGANA